jgi:hypothetical protein
MVTGAFGNELVIQEFICYYHIRLFWYRRCWKNLWW